MGRGRSDGVWEEVFANVCALVSHSGYSLE